ncbi:unnamed protein product [Lactuca saligna]|uniref:Uncharacterized protein n=1 Tax=Lactuca saligna TaxID=75948 RepID=A0AA35ZQ35_LACSI|nr:unnamed protein product [Lactuca saligna]
MMNDNLSSLFPLAQLDIGVTLLYYSFWSCNIGNCDSILVFFTLLVALIVPYFGVVMALTGFVLMMLVVCNGTNNQTNLVSFRSGNTIVAELHGEVGWPASSSYGEPKYTQGENI